MRMLIVGDEATFRSFEVGDVLDLTYTNGYGWILSVATADGRPVMFVDRFNRIERDMKLGSLRCAQELVELIAMAAGKSPSLIAQDDEVLWQQFVLCPPLPAS